MRYPQVLVRAKLKPGADKREPHDRGLLYPHPAGHRGHYLGWRTALDSEQAEHVIPASPGLSPHFRQTGEASSDMFLQGFETRLVRTSPVSVEETPDIRRAFRDGDLERVEA